jgi:hypothetical protein
MTEKHANVSTALPTAINPQPLSHLAKSYLAKSRPVNSQSLLTPQEKKHVAKEQKNGIDAVARIRATPRNDTL